MNWEGTDLRENVKLVELEEYKENDRFAEDPQQTRGRISIEKGATQRDWHVRDMLVGLAADFVNYFSEVQYSLLEHNLIQ
jgi:hypothetical protein